MKKKLVFLKQIIEIVICINIVILSVKKGGFYSNDSTFFVLAIISMSLIYFFINYILKNYFLDDKKNSKLNNKEKNENKSSNKINKISFFSFIEYIKKHILDIVIVILPISYLMTCIFSKYAYKEETFDEFLRIISAIYIYYIVKNSNYKKYYINTIIVIGVLHSIIGIDSISLQYLEPYFRKFNTGYIKRDYERMSSTIQYANVLAILTYISIMFVLNKLLAFLKSENKIKNNKQTLINYVIFNLLISTVIFTGTRLVYVITAFSLIWYIIFNKNVIKNIIYFLPGIVTTIIYSAIMSQYLYIKSSNGYYIFLIYILILTVISFCINTVIKKDIFKEKENNSRKNIKKIVIISTTFIAIVVYIGISFNITKPLSIDEDLKTSSVSRQLSNINEEGTNEIQIKAKTNEKNTSFVIKIVSEDDEYNRVLLSEIKSEDFKQNETLKKTFDMVKKTNKVYMVIYLNSGSVDIEKVIVNEVENKIEYAYIPTEFVYRIKSMIYKSQSFDLRVEYAKDALKLIKKYPIFGYGADGFKNNYRTVQNQNYTSSEVHSSFLQVAVEVGIVPFLSLFLIVFFTILKRTNNVKAKKESNKIYLHTFILITLHSMFDLNFSYLIYIVIYYILVAILNEENIKK